MTRTRRPPTAHPSDQPPPEAAHRPGWVPRRDLRTTPDPDAGTGPAEGPEAPGGTRPSRPAWALPAALATMAVVYPAAFLLKVVPFWSAMVVLSAVSWWAAWHPYLRARLRPTRRLVAMGVLSGLALYALFLVGALLVRATPLWPSVQGVVEHIRTTAPGGLAVLVIVFGTSPSEEVLWRGAVFARLTRRYGPGWRPVVATTAAYGLFVGLSGSLVLALAALVCGTVWARQRQVTGSLVPGLVSHALWALLLFTYIPGLR
ncbi:MAG TPA: type II CAAX endopeptidase family protein [Actinomycetes bacterium]|nr:type II CAAX endopeptidase family protein [Actinomycetes bacterium]